MRTTLTLDDDVAELVAAAVHSQQLSMKDVINTAIRDSLEKRKPRQFQVNASDMGLRSSIDPDRLNQLVDEIEAQGFKQ